jgi:hypothetical protein
VQLIAVVRYFDRACGEQSAVKAELARRLIGHRTNLRDGLSVLRYEGRFAAPRGFD